MRHIQEIRDRLLKELYGGLWHTTTRERYTRIVLDGFISPTPDIPDCNRWSTSAGQEFYPYVRSLGGVSLFDFYGFDQHAYSEKFTNSTWRTFVPYREECKEAVWIEIDRDQIPTKYISGDALLAQWHMNGHGRLLMPVIEAAYIGPLPSSSFKRALLVREKAADFLPLVG